MVLDDIPRLQSPDAQAFLLEHFQSDPHELILTHAGRTDLPIGAIADQIACSRKARRKLPSLAGTGFLYHPVALEQCSGEPAARHKAHLLSGKRLFDLTAGLGIDALHLRGSFDEVHCCERSPVLAELLRVNLRILGRGDVVVHEGDCMEVLAGSADGFYDWLYLDPSRRTGRGRRIRLEDSSPNVLEHQDLLHAKGRQVCIKATPLLEPRSLAGKLWELSECVFVSDGRECKELLLLCGGPPVDGRVRTRAHVVSAQGAVCFAVEGVVGAAQTAQPGPIEAGSFLFEPDPAIIRARLSHVVARQFGLRPINASTDYLAGDADAADFPGRRLRVVQVLRWRRRGVGTYLGRAGVRAATVCRRDFPMSTGVLRRMFRLKESDTEFLVFTRDGCGRQVCIHARRA